MSVLRELLWRPATKDGGRASSSAWPERDRRSPPDHSSWWPAVFGEAPPSEVSPLQPINCLNVWKNLQAHFIYKYDFSFWIPLCYFVLAGTLSMDATLCFMKYTSGFSFVKFECLSNSFIFFGVVVAMNNCLPKVCCDTIVPLLIHLFCPGKNKLSSCVTGL